MPAPCSASRVYRPSIDISLPISARLETLFIEMTHNSAFCRKYQNMICYCYKQIRQTLAKSWEEKNRKGISLIEAVNLFGTESRCQCVVHCAPLARWP